MVFSHATLRNVYEISRVVIRDCSIAPLPYDRTVTGDISTQTSVFGAGAGAGAAEAERSCSRRNF